MNDRWTRLRAACAAATAILAAASCDAAKPDGPPDLRLTVVGLDGTERVLDRAALTALPVVSGHGGILNTAGRITPPAPYRGVTLATLADLAGGITDEIGLRAVASDDYAVTLSPGEVRDHRFVTFDPADGTPNTPAGTPDLVLAFERDGRPMTEADGGPLRVVVLTGEPEQISEGHLWVRSVVRIELVPVETEWHLRLVGTRTETIPRSFFEAGAAPGCHRATWVDEEGRTWIGIPLWLLVGWVDDYNVHRAGAFHRGLAAEGYPIDLVSSDGTRLTIPSDRVSLDDGILLAHRVDGGPLEAAHFPLRLVGASVAPTERLGRLEEIVLHLP
jgi:DMSO/TMAO reductase YedYZ molybdopterin-dependent catalytic subunit